MNEEQKSKILAIWNGPRLTKEYGDVILISADAVLFDDNTCCWLNTGTWSIRPFAVPPRPRPVSEIANSKLVKIVTGYYGPPDYVAPGKMFNGPVAPKESEKVIDAVFEESEPESEAIAATIPIPWATMRNGSCYFGCENLPCRHTGAL